MAFFRLAFVMLSYHHLVAAGWMDWQRDLQLTDVTAQAVGMKL